MTITNITEAEVVAGLHFAEGYRWGGSTITYSLPGTGASWAGYSPSGYSEPFKPEYSLFSQVQADAFRSVMASFASYTATPITEVSDSTPGDLRIAFSDVNAGGTISTAGYAYTPPYPGFRGDQINGDIWIDEEYVNTDFARGGLEYAMLIHEVGHALGLKHAMEDVPLPTKYASGTYSIMSSPTESRWVFYRTEDGGVDTKYMGMVYNATPMVLDILAIQKFYGANTTTASGDTVYALTDADTEFRQSIYDAGGTDTLDLTALSRGSNVDLRQGAYSDMAYYSVDQQVADAVEEYGSWAEDFFRDVLSDFGGYTYTNNFGIAFSTVIENVRGSAQADDVTGNEVANLLDGAGGADILRGLGGDDTYLVDNAADQVFEAAGEGADTVRASASFALAVGQSIETMAAAEGTAAIDLTGNELVQTLQGNAGANVLDGKGGADVVSGLGGNDTYLVDDAGDRVVEAAGAGTDTVRASVSYGLAAGQSIEVLGTTGATGTARINLTGNELAQTLYGNAGANVLDGRGGADVLSGYGGNDTYLVDTAGDRVVEAAGGGTDTVRTSVSYVLAARQSVEILATTGAAGTALINLTGNELAQTLYGNAGANVLDGRGGADALYGYGGDDTYLVDHAADRVIEAAGGGADTVRASVDYTLAEGQSIEILATNAVAGTKAIVLAGNALAQTLQGNAGDNILDGGGGADRLSGFGGDDDYWIDDAADLVFEAANAGDDDVFTSVSYTLAARQSIEFLGAIDDEATVAIDLTGNELAQTLQGNAGANLLDGKGGADEMVGLGGNDRFRVDHAGDLVWEEIGGGSADQVEASVSYALAAGQQIETLATNWTAGTAAIGLTGNEFAQTVRGNMGANVLDGGAGSDLLYGHGGRDSFVFSTALGTANVDRIADFSAIDDTIQLSGGIFKALTAGVLSDAAFKDLGRGTIDASDRILYDSRSGSLAYDADGSGSAKAVTFAVLTTKPTDLGASDFLIA